MLLCSKRGRGWRSGLCGRCGRTGLGGGLALIATLDLTLSLVLGWTLCLAKVLVLFVLAILLWCSLDVGTGAGRGSCAVDLRCCIGSLICISFALASRGLGVSISLALCHSVKRDGCGGDGGCDRMIDQMERMQWVKSAAQANEQEKLATYSATILMSSSGGIGKQRE